MPTVIN